MTSDLIERYATMSFDKIFDLKHENNVNSITTRGLASWRLYEYILIDITLLSDISNLTNKAQL